MAVGSAWLDGSQATDEEKLDLADFETWQGFIDSLPDDGSAPAPVRRAGSHIKPRGFDRAGDIYVSTGFLTVPEELRDNYAGRYHWILDRLFELDPRVAAGHAYKIEII